MLSRLVVCGVCAAVAVGAGCGFDLGDADQGGADATASKAHQRFAECSTGDLRDLSDDTDVSLQALAKSVDWRLSSYSVSYIQDIDQFLNTCPQNDPALATILSDFEIRRNGIPVTSFPCSEPISAMPVSQYTEELIVLQGLRVI